MEKAKIPKSVAEAMEKTWDKYQNNVYPKHVVLTNWRYLDDLAPEYKNVLLLYYTENPVKYVQALVNEYEIEVTPEEKAIQWLIKRKCIDPRFSEHDIVMVIKKILNGEE